MAKKYRLLFAVAGFILGIILSVITYISIPIDDVYIHLLSFVFIVFCFYAIEFLYNVKLK
jgi:hypothetical protein